MMPGFSSQQIVGGESSDLWNTLWGVDFVWSKLMIGDIPYETDQSNVPNGGTIWIADYLVHSQWGPCCRCWVLHAGYQVWLIGNAVLLGLCAHGFALDLGPKKRKRVDRQFRCMFSGKLFFSTPKWSIRIHRSLLDGCISVDDLACSSGKNTMVEDDTDHSVGRSFSSWYAALMIGDFLAPIPRSWAFFCCGQAHGL